MPWWLSLPFAVCTLRSLYRSDFTSETELIMFDLDLLHFEQLLRLVKRRAEQSPEMTEP